MIKLNNACTRMHAWTYLVRRKDVEHISCSEGQSSVLLQQQQLHWNLQFIGEDQLLQCVDLWTHINVDARDTDAEIGRLLLMSSWTFRPGNERKIHCRRPKLSYAATGTTQSSSAEASKLEVVLRLWVRVYVHLADQVPLSEVPVLGYYVPALRLTSAHVPPCTRCHA